MIRRILSALRRRDYNLQEQMAAVRAVISQGPQPRLRIRFEKADQRYDARRSA